MFKSIYLRALELRDPTYEYLSQKRVMILLTTVPVLLLFGFINLFPIGWAISASFFEILLTSPEWTWVGLRNFAAILTDAAFWDSLWLSVIFAGGSVLLQLVLGVGFALLLSKEFKFAKIIRAIAFLPYLIPTVVFGYLALWMGNSHYGIINAILVDLGVIAQPVAWFATESTAMIATILTNTWKYALFVTIMVLARIQSIPNGYYEAAEVAGANSLRQFWDITLPNLKGVIFIVLLLRGIWMFLKFDIIWVLTRGGPDGATNTAPVYAYRLGFQDYSLGMAAAASTLLFVLLVVAGILYFYFLKPEEEVKVE